MEEHAFNGLMDYLKKVPGIDNDIETGSDKEDGWMVLFKLDTNHILVWQVLQRLSCMNNVVSENAGLPLRFYPVATSPETNRAASDFLYWVIEVMGIGFSPDDLIKWLEENFPHPVEELAQWGIDED